MASYTNAVTDQVKALIKSCSQQEAQYLAALLWLAVMAIKPTNMQASEIYDWARGQLAGAKARAH